MKPSKAPQPGFAAKIPRAPKTARTKGAEFLAGVSLLIGGMEVAVAVPIVQTPIVQKKTQNMTSARTSTLSSWNQFDASLGTLDSVSIALSGWDNSGEVISATFATQASYVSTLSFSVAGFSDINTAFQSFDPAALSGPAEISIANLFSPILINDWIGNSTFNLVASMDSQCAEGNSSYNCGNPDKSSWYGQFTLTYDYTAPTPPPPGPSVPEPAGLALTGLGLAMLGVQRRRKAAKS